MNPSSGWAGVSAGGTTVGFDSGTGAVNKLVCGGVEWASSDRTLLELDYRIYSAADSAVYQPAYSGLSNPPGWFAHDFGKPGDTTSVHSAYSTTLLSAWADSEGTTALLELGLNSTDAVVLYGGAAQYWLKVAVSPTDGSIAATVTVVNKTATRHPEALFVRFNPPQVSVLVA